MRPLKALFLGVILGCGSTSLGKYNLPASDPAEWVACKIRVGAELITVRVYQSWELNACQPHRRTEQDPRNPLGTIAASRFDKRFAVPLEKVNYELGVYEYPGSRRIGVKEMSEIDSAIAEYHKVGKTSAGKSEPTFLKRDGVRLTTTSKAESLIRDGRRWMYMVWFQHDVPENVYLEIYATPLTERTFLEHSCRFSLDAVPNHSKLEARRGLCRRLFETLEIAPAPAP